MATTVVVGLASWPFAVWPAPEPRPTVQTPLDPRTDPQRDPFRGLPGVRTGSGESAGTTAGHESFELHDVIGSEFVKAGHTEQPHRPRHIRGQDLDGTVDTGPAARHQAVEIGATTQVKRAPCATAATTSAPDMIPVSR